MTYVLEHERRLAELRYSQSRLVAGLQQDWVDEGKRIPIRHGVAPTEAIELLLRETAELCTNARGLLEATAQENDIAEARRLLESVAGRYLQHGAGKAIGRIIEARPEGEEDWASHGPVLAEFAALVFMADAVAKACGR